MRTMSATLSAVRLSVGLIRLGVILQAVTAPPNLTDPPGQNVSVHDPPGQNVSVHDPPGRNVSVLDPQGQNVFVHDPPVRNVSVHDPPGQNVFVHDPPGQNVSVHDPPGQNVSVLDPQGQNVSVLDPPGQNVSVLDPPGQNVSVHDPPGQNVSVLDPPGQNVSVHDPPKTDVNISSLIPNAQFTTGNVLLTSTETDTRSNVDSSHMPSQWKPTVPGGPGDSKRTLQFYVDINKCHNRYGVYFRGREGMIRGFINKDTFDSAYLNRTRFLCWLVVVAPKGLYLKAYSRIFSGPGELCNGTTRMAVNNINRVVPIIYNIGTWGCDDFYSGTSPLILASGNTLYFRVDDHAGLPDDFWVYFTSTPTLLSGTLHAVYQTPTSGYIAPHGYQDNVPHTQNAKMLYTLRLPENHVVMISLRYNNLGPNSNCLTLFSVDDEGGKAQLWKLCHVAIVDANVYNTSLVVRLESGVSVFKKGFQMLFSFHPVSASPVKLHSGLFDCSKHFSAVRHHLDCNVRPECEGGEDEADHCPYHSPHCPGAVRFEGKCISLEDATKPDLSWPNWPEAITVCQQLGGEGASLHTAEELDRVKYLFDVNRKSVCGYVGLLTPPVWSNNMYRKTLRWVDNTTLYDGTIFISRPVAYTLYNRLCANMILNVPGAFAPLPCMFPACAGIFCERNIDQNKTLPTQFVKFPTLGKTYLSNIVVHGIRLVACPDDHVTHDFLSCDFYSHCKAGRYISYCVTETEGGSDDNVKDKVESTAITVEMFACQSGRGAVPYTLLCDFLYHCEDGSDEMYCYHRNYTSLFRCKNGQHVELNKVCDIIIDCLDVSDEIECQEDVAYMASHSTKGPPVIINFDGRGSYTEVSMENDTAPCPVTHFRCPGQSVYCMPVYLRCNHIKDCLGGEDELSCDHFTCPGFYRCRGSIVCLHPSHLCDGWSQCPQRDDELICNLTCPSACQCQGLAFVCTQPFPADTVPDLRYLDGAGSGIAPSALADNFYLVYLRLSDCGLDSWPEVTFQNLQRLDLSDNTIHILNLRTFVLLKNLVSLLLTGNPLTSLFTDDPDPKQHRLMTIDLSRTGFAEFSSASMANFPSLRALNLSHSAVTSFSKVGFSGLPRLKQLDLTGCDFDDFPDDLFHRLYELAFVFASNYKLCCQATLPENFNQNFCFAPKDEISSCDDLLRSGFYRVFLWIISFLSMLGNAGCLVLRLVFQRRSITRSGYNMFVTCLSLSDFLMGVYLAIVGVADQQYRGRYLWYENTWKSSLACRVAGFLSLLSNEVSALMISLITLDRFIVLRFPFSSVRFKGRSAVVTSVMTWMGGVLLAAVPLMPSLTHWGFYSQTGICIPLPVTRNSFLGRGYSFGVMIVFNFILFVAIACGQAVIYWSIRANSMASQDTTNASRDLTVARRLITVAVSDFLCWFPIGLLGLLAVTGMPVPGEVNVAMAIFVLPLNSALNPFLYTLNIVMEKRRRLREDRLRRFLLSRAAVQKCDNIGCH